MTASTTKFGCAFACEIIEGAKPQNAPPTIEAGVEASRRENIQYQANAVPARPRVSTIAQVTPGPSNTVTGISGMLRPSMAVFAIRLTPRG